MAVQCENAGKLIARAPMSVFERYLTLWVFICILVGIGAGQLFPGIFRVSGAWRWRRSTFLWASSSG